MFKMNASAFELACNMVYYYTTFQIKNPRLAVCGKTFKFYIHFFQVFSFANYRTLGLPVDYTKKLNSMTM